MKLLLATVLVAAAGAQRGATPTGHALLLGTQRTGTTWAMAELAKSPCVSTTVESASTTLSTPSSHDYSRSSARPLR